jgi:cytochrome c biogenesis factor
LISFDASRAKKLSLWAILLGIVGGIIGLIAGLFLGFALGAMMAKLMHISSFEGGSGYFAIAIAVLVTVLVTPVTILLTLYWRRDTRDLAVHRAGGRLCVDVCHWRIWFGDLVCSSATRSESERANATALI